MHLMYRSARAAIADNPLLLASSFATLALLWVILLRSPPAEVLTGGVATWWMVLCGVAVCNFCGWRLSAGAVARRRDTVEPTRYQVQVWQLVLSAVYVLGCGFRSVLPRADVQRIGLYDSWISSVMVGRSVATVAELCFAAQCALLLHQLARDGGSRVGVVVSWLLVPLIVVAEVCSWYAVLSTCYLGNALEESIWALCAALLVISFIALWPRCPSVYRPFLAAALLLGAGYVAFMCMVDVPMYLSRWLADEASGRAYLTLGQGLQDAWARRSITFEWDAWQPEIPWMTLYFSVGVWCSIALAHAPWLTKNELATSAQR
jgi:hypothetical protein